MKLQRAALALLSGAFTGKSRQQRLCLRPDFRPKPPHVQRPPPPPPLPSFPTTCGPHSSSSLSLPAVSRRRVVTSWLTTSGASVSCSTFAVRKTGGEALEKALPMAEGRYVGE